MSSSVEWVARGLAPRSESVRQSGAASTGGSRGRPLPGPGLVDPDDFSEVVDRSVRREPERGVDLDREVVEARPEGDDVDGLDVDAVASGELGADPGVEVARGVAGDRQPERDIGRAVAGLDCHTDPRGSRFLNPRLCRLSYRVQLSERGERRRRSLRRAKPTAPASGLRGDGVEAIDDRSATPLPDAPEGGERRDGVANGHGWDAQ